MTRRGAAFTVALTLVSTALLAETLRLSSGSRLAPLWVIVPTLGLLAFELTRLVRGTPGGEVVGPANGTTAWSGASADDGATVSVGPALAGRATRLLLWGALLLCLVWTLGFLAAVPLYLAPYLRAEADLSWKHSLAMTTLIAVAFWVVFALLMRAPFPRGALLG